MAVPRGGEVCVWGGVGRGARHKAVCLYSGAEGMCGGRASPTHASALPPGHLTHHHVLPSHSHPPRPRPPARSPPCSPPRQEISLLDEVTDETGAVKRLCRIGAGVTNEMFRSWVLEEDGPNNKQWCAQSSSSHMFCTGSGGGGGCSSMHHTSRLAANGMALPAGA